MLDIRRLLLGRRLASDESHHTKVGNVIGLSIFSSDALSSVAYATQEVMASLSSNLHTAGALAGGAALALFGLSVPVAISIVVLLVILGVGYRQTILAYPGGGGAYIVAKENLGELSALTAGAALLTGYILTVAASVSAGVSAITSAFPVMAGWNVSLAVLCTLFICIANLRGVKESGALFAIPTYGFVLLMALMLGVGFIKVVLNGGPSTPQVQESVRTATHASIIGIVWIFMRAFSAGCTALTGVEAISNGIQAFKEPSAKNAARTMVYMIILLGAMFLGITILSRKFGVTYMHSADASQVAETLLSKLAKAIYGAPVAGLPKLLYYLTQTFTFAILVVAANTAYADFPRLSAIMAADGYMPKQLASRGDRLVFSNGIIFLTLVSCGLVWLCHANTDLLLPMYGFGVFLGFTLSQAGMVMHWISHRHVEPRWRLKVVINVVGSVAAGAVALDIGLTKFIQGTWVVVVLIPILVMLCLRVHRHYVSVRSRLAASRTEEVYARPNRVVIFVSKIHRGTLEALRYAKAITGNREVEALTVDFPDDHGRPSAERGRLEADWHKYCEGIPLRVLNSPFRKVVEPIIEELERMSQAEPECTTTILLPEFVADRWWGNLLHNQTAWRLKAMLLARPRTVVISIPYHLDTPGE